MASRQYHKFDTLK